MYMRAVTIVHLSSKMAHTKLLWARERLCLEFQSYLLSIVLPSCSSPQTHTNTRTEFLSDFALRQLTVLHRLSVFCVQCSFGLAF